MTFLIRISGSIVNWQNSDLFKRHWNSHGISVIEHIVKSDFQILKKEELERKIILYQ